MHSVIQSRPGGVMSIRCIACNADTLLEKYDMGVVQGPDLQPRDFCILLSFLHLVELDSLHGQHRIGVQPAPGFVPRKLLSSCWHRASSHLIHLQASLAVLISIKILELLLVRVEGCKLMSRLTPGA